MVKRHDVNNTIRELLKNYKNGITSPGDTRKKLNRLIRRLISHNRPLDGKVFETYWSESAAMTYPNTTDTEVDHSVPVACIVEDMMFETIRFDGSIDAALLSLDCSWYKLVRLTKEEHRNLSKTSMPLCWYKLDGRYQWMARYDVAKIKIVWKEEGGNLVSA